MDALVEEAKEAYVAADEELASTIHKLRSDRQHPRPRVEGLEERDEGMLQVNMRDLLMLQQLSNLVGQCRQSFVNLADRRSSSTSASSITSTSPHYFLDDSFNIRMPRLPICARPPPAPDFDASLGLKATTWHSSRLSPSPGAIPTAHPSSIRAESALFTASWKGIG